MTHIATASSAPVTQIPERVALTLLCVAVVALAFVAMRRGWLAKANRYADLLAPQIVPTSPIQVGPFEVRVAGTVRAGHWLDRVTAHGLGTVRSAAIAVHEREVSISDENWSLVIDRSQIANIETGRGIAGDVVDADGMIVITWLLGDTYLATGIRVYRNFEHNELLAALSQLSGNTNQGAH